MPAVLVLVATFAGGPLDPRYQALGGPFDLRGLGGVLLVANQVGLAVTTLAVMVAAGSLVGRFRRASGLERLQLRWVALAALVVALAGVAVLAALVVGVPGGTALVSWAVGVCLAILPLATGAAAAAPGVAVAAAAARAGQQLTRKASPQSATLRPARS